MAPMPGIAFKLGAEQPIYAGSPINPAPLCLCGGKSIGFRLCRVGFSILTSIPFAVLNAPLLNLFLCIFF